MQKLSKGNSVEKIRPAWECNSIRVTDNKLEPVRDELPTKVVKERERIEEESEVDNSYKNNQDASLSPISGDQLLEDKKTNDQINEKNLSVMAQVFCFEQLDKPDFHSVLDSCSSKRKRMSYTTRLNHKNLMATLESGGLAPKSSLTIYESTAPSATTTVFFSSVAPVIIPSMTFDASNFVESLANQEQVQKCLNESFFHFY